MGWEKAPNLRGTGILPLIPHMRVSRWSVAHARTRRYLFAFWALPHMGGTPMPGVYTIFTLLEGFCVMREELFE